MAKKDKQKVCMEIHATPIGYAATLDVQVGKVNARAHTFLGGSPKSSYDFLIRDLAIDLTKKLVTLPTKKDFVAAAKEVKNGNHY